MNIKCLMLLLATLVAGCSETPSNSINKLVVCAASGDINGINLLLEKHKINADLIKQAVKQLDKEKDFLKSNHNTIIEQANNLAKHKVWDVFYDEVKKGKSGSLANLKIVKETTDKEYRSTVLVQFYSGKQTIFQLSVINKNWIITGLNLDMFKKIDAKPSFSAERIKSLGEFVGKYKDDKFYMLLGPELKKLVGVDYQTLINNMSVSGHIRREGQYIVLQGNAPLSGGSDEGIIVIDVNAGILSAAIMKNRKVDRYSDINGNEDFPYLINSWNKE